MSITHVMSEALFVYLFALCFVSVVFFKQKAADEMRISDWSSDVCSSDLLEMVVQFGHGADRAARAAHRVGLVDGNGRQDAFDAVDLRLEIGRASCRERVCQYV